ncbi:hypothetical protein ADIARSV_0354 [Arcticibacter svalbardensis MN12-7]|uniref:Cytochrome C oxidase subunit I n=1 Tax=Arcticibacter svalbardensis MN12-7 TaxID=1150600 RepID=R9GXF7_9SPHI|nr:hypothetical protein [Arcticibacter svalbardensis]EOR96451.1 hypothetical protein ADIARSV_0354 [Arcticibacter svalbardensis MN12-7]
MSSSLPKQSDGMYKLVLLHYFISGLCFLLLAVLFLFSIKDISGHYFNPHLLAITHLAALGWGTLVIFGACYQLLPVLLETDLYSSKLPWFTFVLFIPGLFCLIYSFWVFEPGIHMQAGGLLLTSAILTFCITVIRTAKKSKVSSIHKEFIVTSSIWLVATALVGTLLVFNFHYAFLPKDHLQYLRLHAHMGLAGWFLMLIIGVSCKLIPMFLVSRIQLNHLLSWSYYLVNLALLLFLIDGYFYGINLHTYFITMVLLAGLSCYFVYVKKCFDSRLKKKLDIPILKTVLSISLLSLALILIPVIIYSSSKQNGLAVHYSIFYGMLLFMGWITALIMGHAFKTLPFIVWVRKYEHLSGKRKIPMPADLYSSKLLKLQYVSYIAFCILFFCGYLLYSPVMMIIGIGCLLISSVAYLLNLVILIKHKDKSLSHERI